jgi:hypothetical protein
MFDMPTIPATLARMVVPPAATPVATPPFTEATAALSLVHVTLRPVMTLPF